MSRRALILFALLSPALWTDSLPESEWSQFALEAVPWGNAAVGDWCLYEVRDDDRPPTELKQTILRREGESIRVAERRKGARPFYDEVEVFARPLTLEGACAAIRESGLQVEVLGASVEAETLSVQGQALECEVFFTHLRVDNPRTGAINELEQRQWYCASLPGSGLVRLERTQTSRMGPRSLTSHQRLSLLLWGRAED